MHLYYYIFMTELEWKLYHIYSHIMNILFTQNSLKHLGCMFIVSTKISFKKFEKVKMGQKIGWWNKDSIQHVSPSK